MEEDGTVVLTDLLTLEDVLDGLKNLIIFNYFLFFASGGGLYPDIYSITLRRIRIIVEEAGFEPGTAGSAVWLASNEPRI